MLPLFFGGFVRVQKTDDLIDQARELYEDACRTKDKNEKEAKRNEAYRLINIVFNRNMTNPVLMYYVGTWNMEMGNHGIAAVLLNTAINIAPDLVDGWNNLGICFKKEFYHDQALSCFQKAHELDPSRPEFMSNAAGCFINEGRPDECIKYADMSLAVGENSQGKWHKGLGLLEKQDWEHGWDYYEARLEPDAGLGVAVRNYHKDGMTPWWDGKSKGLVVLHGEQGLGDEIMFSSIIEDALQTGAEFVFECAPRLEELLKRSLPIEVHGTHRLDGSEWLNGRVPDYKCAIGSLGKFFRRNESSFPGKPYLKADPRKVRDFKKRLKSLGNRPKIGIAWQGGVATTRVDLRSILIEYLAPIVKQDADFISLQYTKHAADEIAQLKEKTGNGIIHWKEAAEAQNMDDYAALVASLDLVISVCQTAVHISGALGVPCWCWTPYAPAWRYGVTGNMPWYNSVDLIRQDRNETWEPVILRTSERLTKYLQERKAA